MLAGQQLGTGLGAAAIQSMQRQQQYQQALAVGTGSESVPTFEDIRRNAIIATRKAFERHNIYGREPSKYAMALRKSNLPRYGMRLWKDLVKPRKPDAR
jgi:hypothetical protein